MSLKNNDFWKILLEYNFNIDLTNISEITCLICKDILKNATQSTCGCNFCLECITNYLEDKSKICPSGRKCCLNDFLTLDKDIQIDYKMNKIVFCLKVKCPNDSCFFEDTLGLIGDHIRVCEKKDTSCPFANLGCDESKIMKTKLVDHLHENICSHSIMLAESIKNMNNDINLIRNIKDDLTVIERTEKTLQLKIMEQSFEIEKLKADNLILTQTVENLMKINTNNAFQEIYNKINEIDKKIEKLSTSLTKKDVFIWKIDDFRQKQKKCLPVFKKELLSNPFYTFKEGYKMRLRIHPNGFGNGINSHLFVSFCLMKGDYDDFLQWPFNDIINISLVDQDTCKDYKVFTFHYDKVSEEFKDIFSKPKNQMNKCLGEDEFIKFEELFNNPALLKDDSIMIRCYCNTSE